MYKAVQQCNHCGANLSLDDMRRDDCPYCNTVYPHKSMQAQHQQMVNGMMGNMMAQQAAIQNQWRAAAGVGPMPGPPGGPPPVGMPPAPGAYGSPYADPAQMAAMQAVHVHNTGRAITMIIAISMIGVLVAIGASLAVFML